MRGSVSTCQQELNHPTPYAYQIEERPYEQQKAKRTAAQVSFDIGIAEGGARTHDLEVDLFAAIRATRSTN